MNRPIWSLRRRTAALLIATLGLGWAVAGSAQQTFPNKPIRLLLPYGAGGIGDTTARVIAQKIGENMGQQIIVDNRASAGGVQAFLGGIQAPADGYTLVMGGNGTAISQSLFKSLPYNILTDFTQVSAMSKFSLLLLVSPDSRFHSVAELIAYGKANPGKLTFGTSSIGSTQHLAAELFKSVAGVQAEVVPFKVAGALYTSLHAGDIDLAFEFVPPVLTQIKAGNVRALAIAADKRNPSLPDVPTTAESGLRGYEVSSFNAVSVKAGTPRAIVDRLNQAFVAAINSPEVTRKLHDMNSEPYALTPEQTRQLMASEITRWKAVIEHAHIPRN
ncbi:MAG: tripartite tricarboxylate transporter substrate binding protein [Pseudomonadota bacterium]